MFPTKYRGKHLRALLKAFKPGGGGHSAESSMHFGGSRLHSFASIPSFSAGSRKSSAKFLRDEGAALSTQIAAGSMSTSAATQHTGLDRSQLSFLNVMHLGARAEHGGPHQKKLSWSNMQLPMPLHLHDMPVVGAGVDGLSLNLSLDHDQSPLLMPCTLYSNPNFSANLIRGPFPTGTNMHDVTVRTGSGHNEADDDDDYEGGSVVINSTASDITAVAQRSLEAQSTMNGSVALCNSMPELTRVGTAVLCQPGGRPKGALALGEGDEDDGDAQKHVNNSVSFGVQQRRAHHRHKSSNYSRLLDVRVDDWCAPCPVLILWLMHALKTPRCSWRMRSRPLHVPTRP
jgi:hypothetical protein